MGRVVYLNSEVLCSSKWIPNCFFSKIKGIKTKRSLISLFVCDCHGGFQSSLRGWRDGYLSGWRVRGKGGVGIQNLWQFGMRLKRDFEKVSHVEKIVYIKRREIHFNS